MSADATEEQIEQVAGDHQALAAPAHHTSLLREPFGTAGNQAVGRLLRAVPDVRSARAIHAGALGNHAVGRLLARYEAFEHAKQGDHAKGSLTITRPFSSGGLQANISLTSGEINALADLYASPEELEHADAVELAKLKALIARQLAGEKVEESEWDKATGGRYNRLNLRNAAHFGARNTALIDPGKVGGAPSSANNREKFVLFYNQTVVNAQTAFTQVGLPDPAVKQKWLDRAALSAGFAEHFLMDAFSAGHLFSKDDFISVLSENLRQAGPAGVDLVLEQVAKTVLADPPSNALLASYEVTDKNIPWYGGGGYLGHPNLNRDNPVHGTVFKALLKHLYDDQEGRQAVYSALVKVVHDALSTNKNADGSIGVEVENDFGRWILSGDKTLATSKETQDRIDRAIEQFRRQIDPYRNGPVTGGDPTGDAIKLMNAHFPRPTKATADLINRKVRLVTNTASGTVDALVDVMKKELPSILKALADRGEIRQT